MEKVLVEGEEIYLKKSSWFGWTVTYPIRNSDGTINWKHLIAGRTWKNLLVPLAFVIIMLGVIHEYTTAVRIANECLLNKTVMLLP